MSTRTDCAIGPDAPTNVSVSADDAVYEKVAAEYAAPLARLARAYEANPSAQKDLLQDIHVALWRSLPGFDGRCSLRTWVYRVAHNVAATHVLRNRRRQTQKLTTLDEMDLVADSSDVAAEVDAARVLYRLHELIQRLKPLDRELIILHLEGLPPAAPGRYGELSITA
jgi:RNA polymerase sigma-70 factor (ECF subfamily)